MSTEHASGTTPPEEGPRPTGTEAVASAPAPGHDHRGDAPAYLDAPPPVLPAAPAAPAADDTIQLGKAPETVVDGPAPFQNPYGSPAAPTNPFARSAEGSVPAEGTGPAGAPVAPVAADAPQVAPVAAGNPFAAPEGSGSPAGVPGGAEGQSHHPFGAGQPVGGWAYPSGGDAGVPGGPGPEWGAGAPQPGKGKKRGGMIALVAAVALVAGLAGGLVGAAVTDKDGGSSNTGASHSSTTVTVGDNQKTNDRSPESVAGIAAKALPSTVTIKAQGSSESGTGTGFVFDTEGHILTNNHVVAPAANGGKLTVKFSDGSSYTASVVGRAQGYDVAVIRLDNPPTGKLVPLPLGDSDKVAIGDATIAIGAPYGLEGTVTTGIISAKDRPVASGDETGAQASYMNALQTDASINPGNSGGPLLNGSGAVIGINSAIQSNTSGSGRAGSIGLGFAIPINQAKWVAQTLIKDGTPVYAILGVLRNDDYKGDGAQIQTAAVQGTAPVTAGGPADQAGLKPGDVITKLGGITIDSGPTLVSEIWTHKPGEKVDVEYTRDGKTAKTTVTLGERKGDN
ncbi:trypsin-like peptidase domain-containing protein [Kitasatospora sp. NPDC049285]|uniref:trypsin-like peptidase domain-containing protein n=1 Tax=Kitasatospora sp. NPDC049285 TaxID=3157096 RepID=UPI00342C6EAF